MLCDIIKLIYFAEAEESFKPKELFSVFAEIYPYESRKKKGLPLEGICQSPMIPEWRLQMMANLIFRQYLSEKDKVLALANSILEAHIGDEEETRNIEAMLASRRSELERLSRKIDNYIEMRADGDLSRETFRTKCAELEPRMQQLQKEIEELSAEAQPKEVVDYKEKLEVLQYALEQYTHRNEGEDVPESVIEAFVVKIVVSKDSFDWYLRFDGDPDKPLRCSLKGKRKTTTKITVSGGNSPAMDNSPTGCYQRLRGVPSPLKSPWDSKKRKPIARPMAST